ncbi:hypothetical protein MOQ72_42315 [Saccharopolyspora sp. K220]|uniref:hypothetical protein n=1 Tax=Saccharopolyspora soli TaxID=2926618 RepID=UPI001F56202A|nr:hypothetical protein [Saccharopolyspora soli]MCI2424053.1 hypothetical protein [Saccharopolyspora soli]
MTDGTEHDPDKPIPGTQLRLTGDIFAAPENGWFGTDASPGTANGGGGSDAERRQRMVNTFFRSRYNPTRSERPQAVRDVLSALRSQMQLTFGEEHQPIQSEGSDVA